MRQATYDSNMAHVAVKNDKKFNLFITSFERS